MQYFPSHTQSWVLTIPSLQTQGSSQRDSCQCEWRGSIHHPLSQTDTFLVKSSFSYADCQPWGTQALFCSWVPRASERSLEMDGVQIFPQEHSHKLHFQGCRSRFELSPGPSPAHILDHHWHPPQSSSAGALLEDTWAQPLVQKIHSAHFQADHLGPGFAALWYLWALEAMSSQECSKWKSGGIFPKKCILMWPATGTGHISIPVSIGSLSTLDFTEPSLSNSCEMETKYFTHMLNTIHWVYIFCTQDNLCLLMYICIFMKVKIIKEIFLLKLLFFFQMCCLVQA